MLEVASMLVGCPMLTVMVGVVIAATYRVDSLNNRTDGQSRRRSTSMCPGCSPQVELGRVPQFFVSVSCPRSAAVSARDTCA